MTTPKEENAPLARGVVKPFSPVSTGSAKHTTACKGCHVPTRGKPYCRQCWAGAMAYRHNRAALAYMRMGESQ